MKFLLTSQDSDTFRSSSFVRDPSLSLSCRLKNHSMFSIKPLNMTPSKPSTMSCKFDKGYVLNLVIDGVIILAKKAIHDKKYPRRKRGDL